MSATQTGNPLASAVGENQFAPQAQYGEVANQAALAAEAPVSGSPTVPGTPAAPQQTGPAPTGAVASPAPAPSIPPGYYAMLAQTWDALAHVRGASPVVRQMAKLSKRDAGKRAG